MTTNNQIQNPAQAQQIQTDKNLNVDFSHRLAVPAVDTVDSECLIDSVSLMADRARGVLTMLLYQFDGNCGARISDRLICGVIDSALQEIEDIDATLTAYCATERTKQYQADTKGGV